MSKAKLAALLFSMTVMAVPLANESVYAAALKVASSPTITLTSIVYKSPTAWLIVLNGQKVSADKTTWPREILDMKVEPSLVHLSWFDPLLNGVINVELHPNETYRVSDGTIQKPANE